MKILGLIFAFLGPAFFGFSMSRNAKEELLQINGFIELILHTKYEISIFLTKQNEIFEKFSNDALENCGFLEKLRQSTLDDEKSMLYRTLRENRELLNIDNETLKILEGFSENFGRMAISEQIEKCDSCIKILEEIYNSKKSDVANKVKLYRSVGVICGIAIVLTLI